MLKKVTLCLMAILSSTAALAAGPADVPLPVATGVDLMAPHQDGSWSFGAQANYFEPNADFNYATSGVGIGGLGGFGSGGSSNIDAKSHNVGSDFNWGWGVDVTYHFPGDGRDVTLAFTQLNSSESNSTTSPGDGDSILTGTGANAVFGFINGPSGSGSNQGYGVAYGKVTNNYDSADLTFGQLITAGERITLHPFAGVRYSYIDNKASASYGDKTNYTTITPPTGGPSTTVAVSNEVDTQTLESTFNGAGPRLGSDAAVNLGDGFSLRTTLGVSLLVGSMDIDDNYNLAQYSLTTGALVGDSTIDHTVGSSTRVVPEADAKLAAAYDMDFNNGYGLGLEVGYQVTNYFDAVQDNTVSTLDTSTQYNNFFMQGPYARVELNVA